MNSSRKFSFLCTFIVALLFAAVMGTQARGVASAAASELFFSEYIEGSSLNKAVEIYNGTGDAVDLEAGNYVLEIYFNASSTAGTSIELTGSVAAGDVYVVADNGADDAVLAETDQTSTSNFFNGDDLVVLRKDGAVVDSIGQFEVDPGSQWGSGDTGMQNNTLRRQAEICAGDTDISDEYDPADEWDGFGQDIFDGLGAHTADCDDGNGGDPVTAEELFFSEYIEGSSNNKAIEIYNGTGDTVDLAAGNYVLEFYFNGNSTPGTTIGLTGSVAASGVYIVADNGADDAILAQADQTPTNNFFNGDDLIVLRKDGAVVDSIGKYELDPGSQWGSGDTGTQNNTLRRKAEVCAGDTDINDDYDPAAEWDGFGQDIFDGLGAHTADCDGGNGTPTAAELLLTEIIVTPTNGEFIEIHNPTSSAIDLSNYYVTDATFAGGDTYYYNIVTGSNAGGGGFSDFHARFPDGATIPAGAYQTIAMAGSAAFSGEYGLAPDYELFDDGDDHGEQQMREALPGSINDQGGLTNDGEVVVLYFWDGQSDLVTDVDYAVWGDRDEAVDKTGVSIDGPDADSDPSTYQPDTAIADQDVLAGGAHPFGSSWQRHDLTEGAEVASGGNGVNGEDETSEDLSNTWCGDSPTPGTATECTPPPPVGFCGEPAVFIHEIQGSGATSPLQGNSVIVEGIVVGDFQNNGQPDSGDLDGFYVQEEDAEADGDPETSEGIFVHAPGTEDVSVGQQVRVAGDVAEFGSSGSLVTELTNVSGLLTCAESAPLPAVTDITLPVTDISDFEHYEGMLVRFPQELVIAEYFNFDRFNETVLALPLGEEEDGGRPQQPTAIAEPGPAAAAIAEANALRRITMDDGRTAQNPDPAIHPNGNEFTLDNRFRGGDVIQNATGVMDDAFGLYRIQPTEQPTYIPTNPRPAAPEDVGGSLTVASFNVLNYFTTIDTGAAICGPTGGQECRGADTQEEFERQRAKIIAALSVMDADVVGLIELENHPGDEPLADLVQGLNDDMGAGTYAYIATGAIGTDAIRQGLIYKPATVTPVGSFATLDSTDDPRFDDDRNRPVLAQTFEENAGGGQLTIAVNHLKSKGSSCGGPPDDDPQQGNCNGTRTEAAEAMVDWLAGDPTGSGDADFLIIGDLNAYDKEDPIDALVAAGYTDLLAQYQGEFAYSYVFDGQLGYLDHALANPSLVSYVTGATAWHINADEPDLIDYDMTFKQDAQDALYEDNPYRSSDHDPVIVGLALNEAPVCEAATPSVASLWPPNHQFVSIDVQDVTDPDGDPVTINIDSIFQDEAVDAAGSGNTAPDAQGVGTETAQVRAERVGTSNGRVYYVTFTATDSQGGSCSGVVEVGVPASRNSTAVGDGPLFDSTMLP